MCAGGQQSAGRIGRTHGLLSGGEAESSQQSQYRVISAETWEVLGNVGLFWRGI